MAGKGQTADSVQDTELFKSAETGVAAIVLLTFTMKIVTCVVVFAVLWAWSSSGPVPCDAPACVPPYDDLDNSDPRSAHLHRPQRGFVTTVNKTARYVGKKLHIIKKREDRSVIPPSFQQEKSVPESSVAEFGQDDFKNDLRQSRKADVPKCPTEKHATKRDILDIKQTPNIANSSAPKESRSNTSTGHPRDQNSPSETHKETGAEMHSRHGNKTKRADDSGDPRYILVHDVPPCKKRRSIGDYDQPAPVCNTQGGKNITIIIQNSMEPSEQPRHARSVEEDQHQVFDEREAADHISTGTKAPGNSTEEHRRKEAEAEQVKNVTKRAVVDDQTSVPSAAAENHQINPSVATTDASLGVKEPTGHIMKIEKADADNNVGAGENIAIGRKLLWNKMALNSDNDLYMSDSDDDDNFLNAAAEESVIYPINYEQDQESDGKDEAKIVADFQSDAFLSKLEGIGQVTSVAKCVCAVFTEVHCIRPVIAGRFRNPAEARGCSRACLEVAERYCHLSRSVPIKNTNDSDNAEERARQLERAHHLEVAWLIILVLNIVVGINTLVIGYLCSSSVEKKKRGVFLLHDYNNIPHGID